ncbi:Mu-like prophage major head subunit gpT family protein [Paenibacillus macerans]|uniref:Mu-like prophage major head subunit gpT family protein n=1 Tax=Paenibacillus macerans TaxID=44252 RepID=UPI002DB7B546|nr:Mu-like prophage major head subunit gpT family protein [Paenibacillus macerans]MEC0139729.1 Mu-like prophage major head subunit gpT family protein [Paenibacillus macerans]
MQTALRWDKRVLEPIFKELYSLAMKDKKDFIPLLYNVTTSNKAMESYDGIGGEGLMEEWKHSNNQVFYEDIDELWQKVVKNRKFSDGRIIERDFVDDLQLTEIKRRIASLADAVYKTQQLQAVEFLVNAFAITGPNWRGRIDNYAGPDGKPLCAVDHPYSPTNDKDVQSNLGNKPLNLDSWDETAVAMQEWVDDKGNPMAVIPDTVIVSPYNARAAFKIAGLPDADLPKYEPGSNNFDANMYMGNIKVIVNPFINPKYRKNWFAVDSARLKQFNIWQWRRKIENGTTEDFDSEVTKHKAVGRWGYGFLNYSFIFGHNVQE